MAKKKIENENNQTEAKNNNNKKEILKIQGKQNCNNAEMGRKIKKQNDTMK